jgi:signal transduction histidine kinase
LLRQSGDTLLAILNTVLDYSKIEAGGLALSEKPFNLNLILQKVFSLHNSLAEGRRLKLHLTALSSSDSELVGDPVRVEQVLMNLVSNAVKFTPNGSVHIVAQCKGLPNSDQSLVRLEVADTGVGIDSSHIETLFVPFNQASSRRDVRWTNSVRQVHGKDN